jgi:protein-L-isoaspartate(D-aspartate) O-methyltransferase
MAKLSVQKRRFLTDLQQRFIEMLHWEGQLDTPGLEDAFRTIPRHLFVDQYFHGGPAKPRRVRVDPLNPTKTQLKRVYSNAAVQTDRPPAASSTSQPALVARMLGHLGLQHGMRVLEIGAGTGWNAGLMAHLVGAGGSVVSVELEAEVSRRARRGLRRAGIRNARVITADGAKGHQRSAPFDRIVTTVGVPDIFPAWVDQLDEDGVLLATLQAVPHGPSCLLTRFEKHADHLSGEVVGTTWFIPFRGKHGRAGGEEDQQRRLDMAKSRRKGRTRLAPWICLHPSARGGRLGDLLFFAHLRGLGVEQIGREILISAPHVDGACVADHESLAVYGDEAVYDALEASTGLWLEAGSPTRSDYRLEVWPKGADRSRPREGWLLQRKHSQLAVRLEPRTKRRRGR